MGKGESNGLNSEELKELEQIMALQSKMSAGMMDSMGQTKFIRRGERVQVASRVLAAMTPRIGRGDVIEACVERAVVYTDALLARIDETEKGDA